MGNPVAHSAGADDGESFYVHLHSFVIFNY